MCIRDRSRIACKVAQTGSDALHPSSQGAERSVPPTDPDFQKSSADSPGCAPSTANRPHRQLPVPRAHPHSPAPSGLIGLIARLAGQAHSNKRDLTLKKKKKKKKKKKTLPDFKKKIKQPKKRKI
eukprot:TRINITY_DN4299_c0_g1_i2.p1 TRINITY_DN4299_c0_g1~~TRINITY_DN4299_c0_g1_i2.p1  ORF type:complete len:125 (+),score=18.27 TRINITY_DN4299_c0_g1_i2:124-498(+)